MITKSDFLHYIDAPRHLWAIKHQQLDELSPTPYDMHLMAQGQEVEQWGQRYLEEVVLPGYREGGLERQTRFVDGEFEVITDGLIFDPVNNGYDLFEIKSVTSVKKEHHYDAAFQYLVCRAKIKINKIFIVHLNKAYVREGEIDIRELFVVSDVSEEVAALVEEVKVRRQNALEDISQETHESVEDCLKPSYCPCKSLCHPQLPDDPIYNIPRIHWKKKRTLKDMGKLSIKEIPEGFPLSENQQLHVDVIKSGKVHFDVEAVSDEIAKLRYPLYFLDYETYNPGIPMYDGYHPYQQIVFQYSLHIQHEIGGEIEHQECLITENHDPATNLLDRLSKDIGASGSVIVWNQGFEAGRNREMGVLHPTYAEFLTSLNERMFDLAVIFQKGYYIHPDFYGSYSIKNVLPVMAADVSYSGMEIPNGTEAMLAWAKIMSERLSKEEKEKTRADLLAYCKLDTFAMVRILEEVRKLILE